MESPLKDHKDEGKGVSLLGRKAERAGTVQPAKDQAHRDLNNVSKYLKEDVKRMEPGSFQSCPVSGQEPMGTNRNTEDAI